MITFNKPPIKKPKATFKSIFYRILFIQSLICVALVISVYILKLIDNDKYNDYKEQSKVITSQNVDFNDVEINVDKIKEYLELLKNKGGECEYIPQNVYYGDVVLSAKPLYPLKDMSAITSLFGIRKHPITNKEDFHTGIDIAAKLGSDIVSVLPAVVEKLGYDSIYGNYILLRHTDSIYTFYGHCDRVYAEKGAVLRRGERIASVGSTGVSTGPHLHFAVIINGDLVNPINIYKYEL